MTDRHDDRSQGNSRWQDDQRSRAPDDRSDDRSRSGWQAEDRSSSGPLRYDEDLGYSQGDRNDRWGQGGGQFQSQRGQMQGGQYGSGQYGNSQDNDRQGFGDQQRYGQRGYGQQAYGQQGYGNGNTDFRGVGQGSRAMSQGNMPQGGWQRGDDSWQDGGRSWGGDQRQDGFSGSAPYSYSLQGQGGQSGQGASNRGYGQGPSFSQQDFRQNDGSQTGSQSWRTQGSGSSHQGKGPKGYQRSDDRIRESVNDALEDDHDVDASEIEVQVQGGEVTLTGTVGDRTQKRRAEDVAERLRGVKDVHNQLRVMPQGQGTDSQRVSSQPVNAQGTVMPASGQQQSQGSQGQNSQSQSQSGASTPGSTTISASPNSTPASSMGAKPDDVSRR